MTTTAVRSSPATGRVLVAMAMLYLCVAATTLVSAEGPKPKQPTAKYISYAAVPNDDCIKQVPAPAYCCGRSALFGRCPVGWRPAPSRVGARTAAAAADHAH